MFAAERKLQQELRANEKQYDINQVGLSGASKHVVLRVGSIALNVFDSKMKSLATLVYEHIRVQTFPEQNQIFVYLNREQREVKFTGGHFYGQATDMESLAFRLVDRMDKLAAHYKTLSSASTDSGMNHSRNLTICNYS